MGRFSHILFLRHRDLSRDNAFSLPQYERGMGRFSHILFLRHRDLSRDNAFSLPQYERGMGQEAHFVSLLALRVTAGGRNP